MKFLHQKDKSVLTSLAFSSKDNTELAAYVSNDEAGLRSALKVDDNVYVEKNTSTAMKISILRRIFALYEADWPRMAKSPAEWSDKICGAMLPYLQDGNNRRLQNIAGIFREWAMARAEANLNMAKCNRTYTRFTTTGMSVILPDLLDAPSGWNTDNHYFYEIINRNGKEAYIQFAISSKNIADEFRAICDKINEFYPAKMGKEEWQWRTPFKTSNISISEDLSTDAIFASLDSCMEEILAFEYDLAKKMMD